MWGRADTRGDYLNLVLKLWKKADPLNQRLLAPFMISMINKYELDHMAEQVRAEYPSARDASNNYLKEHQEEIAREHASRNFVQA